MARKKYTYKVDIYGHKAPFWRKKYNEYIKAYNSFNENYSALQDKLSLNEFKRNFSQLSSENRVLGRNVNTVSDLVNTQFFNIDVRAAQKLKRKAKEVNDESSLYGGDDHIEEFTITELRQMSFDQIKKVYGPYMSDDYKRIRDALLKEGKSYKEAVKLAKEEISVSYYNSP